jgi:hypothetical protein
MDPTVGHEAAAADLVFNGIETSETAVRRWRKANGYKRSILIEPGKEPKRLNTLPEEGTAEAVAENEEVLRDRIESLTSDNRRLFQQFTKAKARGDEYIEAVYRAARDAAQFVGATPVAPPKADKRTQASEVALWHLTDWQGGKKTISYDRTIMRTRVMRYVEKAREITEIQRADHPVRKAVLLFTGDMVEGVSIFPGQVWELDGTLYEQMFDVSDLMMWTIKQALQIYDEVEVVAEYGNHGRLGKKSDGIKASDNVDRMVYNIVRERLAHEGRLRSSRPPGTGTSTSPSATTGPWPSTATRSSPSAATSPPTASSARPTSGPPASCRRSRTCTSATTTSRCNSSWPTAAPSS